jgi:hypothetical protein
VHKEHTVPLTKKMHAAPSNDSRTHCFIDQGRAQHITDLSGATEQPPHTVKSLLRCPIPVHSSNLVLGQKRTISQHCTIKEQQGTQVTVGLQREPQHLLHVLVHLHVIAFQVALHIVFHIALQIAFHIALHIALHTGLHSVFNVVKT